MVATLMVGLIAFAGCGSDDSAEEEPLATATTQETEVAAEQEPEATEATEVTAVAAEEEPGDTDGETAETTTAVSTGNVIMVQSFDEGGESGMPELQMEVTMDTGQIRTVAVDEDTLMAIWPDGVTAEGVRVTIEVVDGQERVTGPAEG